MRKEKKVVKSLRFDEDLCRKIQERAELMGISFSAVVRIAVEAELNSNPREPGGNNISTSSSNEAMKAAILLLAQGNTNEDTIVDLLGESAVSFLREETRKVSKTTKNTKADSKKVRKPDREAAAEMTTGQPLQTENTPMAVVKPLAQQTEVPKKVAPEAGVNDDNSVTENEQENIIEVSESTDVAFSDDIMANLDSMLGL